MNSGKATTGRKTEILRQLTDYLSEHGFAETSLRPLAAAVGTNARMLIYHFRSKDELLTEVVEELRLRHREIFRRWLDEQQDKATEDLLTYLWNWTSTKRVEHIHRTVLEAGLASGATQGASASSARRLASEWVQLLESALIARGVTSQQARSMATLAIAGVRGLMFDLLTTGDRTRVNAAAHDLSADWKQRLRGKKSR